MDLSCVILFLSLPPLQHPAKSLPYPIADRLQFDMVKLLAVTLLLALAACSTVKEAPRHPDMMVSSSVHASERTSPIIGKDSSRYEPFHYDLTPSQTLPEVKLPEPPRYVPPAPPQNTAPPRGAFRPWVH